MRQFSVNLSGGSGGSSGILVYANVAALPASSTDGDVVYVLSTRKMYSWNNTKVKWVVVGGEGAFIGRINQTAIPISTQTLAVTFTEAMPTSNYSLFASIENIVDTDPIWLQIVETIKGTGGFTVVFNAPTDTGNYTIHWGVAEDAPEEVP